jgi:hypothetical protein
MNLKYRVNLSVMAAGLAVFSMGPSCMSPPAPVNDTVAVDFLNTTDFVVNAFVNGVLVDVVPAHSNPPATILNCSAGDSFQIDGDFLAEEGDIPAENTLVFDEGLNFYCGDTLQVDFLDNGDGTFSLDGLSVPP